MFVFVGRFREELRQALPTEAAAVLLARGTTRRVLRGRRWSRSSQGFYRPASTDDPTPTQRILDAAARLPAGAVIGRWAAAYALGADLLDGRDDHTMQPQPVTVLLPPGLHRQSIAGVRYVQQSRKSSDPSAARMIAGIAFTRPLRTAVDLAQWAPDVTEAVVALDTLLKARLVRPEALASAAADLRRVRGAPTARRAVELSRSGVRSPWEARLRMLWVLELGLPAPLVNRPVFDRSGRFLGIPDLLDEQAGLALEYDGMRWRSDRVAAGHRDPDQHREDNAREELFERAGLIVVRADKVDLIRLRRRLIQRLLDARTDGLQRDRRRDRWTIEEPPGWLGVPA
jgi:hypothetical protein